VRSRNWLLLIAALAATLILPARAGAGTLQPIGAFDQPIFVTSDPANPARLFVVQRAGLIKFVQGGTASTFADLTSVRQGPADKRHFAGRSGTVILRPAG
jgi:ABC-type metal ion transport system substrate-binding protein